MNEKNDDILLRIEGLLKAVLRIALSGKLGEIRADKTLRQIYELTGGDMGIVEIAKKTHVSTGKVSTVWQSWEDSGLVIKVGKSYRKTIG